MPLLRDFFYGFRLFRRNPGFYLLAVLIVSLGIGATTAIFSLIDGVLLNPLPFRDPARLAVIWSDFSRLGGNTRAYTVPALFFDWRERSRSFEGMAAFTGTNRTLTALDPPLTPLTHEVTPNLFDVAGVRAFRGRTFLVDEALPGKRESDHPRRTAGLASEPSFNPADPSSDGSQESVLSWLAANAVDSEALPADLADRYDHYLYGCSSIDERQ